MIDLSDIATSIRLVAVFFSVVIMGYAGIIIATSSDLLGRNCRMPITEMAKKLGSTPRIIKYKMDKWEKEEVLTWNRIILDASKLGREYYKTLVNFKEST